MKSSALLALAAAFGLTQAHSTVIAILVNDVDQLPGNSASGYIRSPPNNNPIIDVTSSSMTCNVNNSPVAKTIDVKGGDKITFEWHHNSRHDDIIDLSHKGPVLTYIAPTSSNGAGNVWVKLAEEGLGSDGKWAVENLVANGGKHSIVLPDLPAGEYLLRPEIIALHEGFSQRGAQFYIECVQIRVTSSGSTALPAGVAIPGTYSATDPGILFNLYNGATSYTIPGPPVWDGASGSAPAPAPAPAPSSSAAPVIPAPAPAPTTKAASPAVTTAASTPTTFSTAVRPTQTASTGDISTKVAKYYQCGGINYTGATVCEDGTICKLWNPYYAQCVEA